MSLRWFEVGSALVILLLCLDDSLSAIPDDTGQDGDGISTIIDSSVTSLELQRSHEVGEGETKEKRGTSSGEVHSKRKKNKHQKGFMEKMLPMMVIPFLVSTSMIPIMLISLKVMILKSAIIGKIAILLMLLNMFRRRTSGEGGVFNHNLNANDVAMEHYGYRGDEEYGAYVN